MDNKEYRKRLDHVSISELNLYLEAPIVYKHTLIDGNKWPETEQMKLGTALHTAVLEPNEFERIYRCREDVDARTAVGKIVRAKEKELEETGGITFLTQESWEKVHGAKKALQNNLLVQNLLDGSENERSFLWTHKEIGQKVKSRIDAINHKDKLVIDLKTTRSVKGFASSIVQYNYHRQAAYYLDCVKANLSPEYNRFMFVCVEMEAPYLNQVYEIDMDSLIIGRAEYETGLINLKVSLEENYFPGLPETVKKIGVPDWYKNKTREIGA